MTSPDFPMIESRLLRLFLLSKTGFSEDAREEVKKYIDVGEYGLALEACVFYVMESSNPVSLEAYGLIEELAGLMSLEEEVLTQELTARVSQR